MRKITLSEKIIKKDLERILKETNDIEECIKYLVSVKSPDYKKLHQKYSKRLYENKNQ